MRKVWKVVVANRKRYNKHVVGETTYQLKNIRYFRDASFPLKRNMIDMIHLCSTVFISETGDLYSHCNLSVLLVLTYNNKRSAMCSSHKQTLKCFILPSGMSEAGSEITRYKLTSGKKVPLENNMRRLIDDKSIKNPQS